MAKITRQYFLVKKAEIKGGFIFTVNDCNMRHAIISKRRVKKFLRGNEQGKTEYDCRRKLRRRAILRGATAALTAFPEGEERWNIQKFQQC